MSPRSILIYVAVVLLALLGIHAADDDRNLQVSDVQLKTFGQTFNGLLSTLVQGSQNTALTKDVTTNFGGAAVVIAGFAAIGAGVAALIAFMVQPLQLINHVLAIIAVSMLITYVVEDSHYAPIEMMDSYYKSWTGAPEYHADPYAYAPHFDAEYQGYGEPGWGSENLEPGWVPSAAKLPHSNSEYLSHKTGLLNESPEVGSPQEKTSLFNGSTQEKTGLHKTGLHKSGLIKKDTTTKEESKNKTNPSSSNSTANKKGYASKYHREEYPDFNAVKTSHFNDVKNAVKRPGKIPVVTDQMLGFNSITPYDYVANKSTDKQSPILSRTLVSAAYRMARAYLS